VQTPTLVQPIGGLALAGLRGKLLTDLTGSRAANTTYYNTSSIPKQLQIVGNGPTAFVVYSLTIDGIIVSSFQPSNASAVGTLSGEVQPGKSYIVTTGFVPTTWSETV
jgi:hypothetical protein